jgi:TP901 family phage tail tape measure protein
MKNSAAIAHDAGVSLTQLASYEAVVATTTRQSGETIGNAMKTMMDRFVQVKAGATEGGDSFNNVEKVLEKYNMTMIDSKGNFKDLGEVINDVGQKWNTLDSFQKNQIATAVKQTAATHSDMWINYRTIDKIEDLCYN